MSEVSEIDEADWTLWRDFSRMHAHLTRELDRRLQLDAGISQADYSVLLTLFTVPDRGLRPGALGDALGWEKSRVSHQLTRMATRGLVERIECDTDARGTVVVLTQGGRLALLRAMRDHATAIRTLFFEVLEPHEKRAISDASSRVLERLDESRELEAG